MKQKSEPVIELKTGWCIFWCLLPLMSISPPVFNEQTSFRLISRSSQGMSFSYTLWPTIVNSYFSLFLKGCTLFNLTASRAVIVGSSRSKHWVFHCKNWNLCKRLHFIFSSFLLDLIWASCNWSNSDVTLSLDKMFFWVSQMNVAHIKPHQMIITLK